MTTTKTTPRIKVDLSKKWYMSKTLWFNVITLTAGVLSMLTGMVTDPEVLTQLVLAQSIVNILLRVVTTQPLR